MTRAGVLCGEVQRNIRFKVQDFVLPVDFDFSENGRALTEVAKRLTKVNKGAGEVPR